MPGTTGEIQIVVTSDMIARFDELGTVHPVYSTWTMIKHMEEASRKVILPFLEEHEEGVGHAVDVVHLAPAAVGARVTVRAVLERVDGNRIHTRVEALSGRGTIGEGRMVQVVLPRARLQERFRDAGAP